MYQIVICDDVPAHATALHAMVRDLFDGETYKVQECHSLDALCAQVQRGAEIDILFMDIELDSGSGIDAVNHLFPVESNTQIIYFTGHSKYCTKVYETQHIGFLLKPVNRDELYKALLRAREHLNAARSQIITLQDQKTCTPSPMPRCCGLRATPAR